MGFFGLFVAMSKGKMSRILEHVERYIDNYTLPQTQAEASFLSKDGHSFCRMNDLGVPTDYPSAS